MRRTSHIPFLALAAALLWQVSCRDAPRDNPFDPEAGILLVSVLTPQDSSVFLVGEKVEFRALARTGYDDLPAGSGWLWSSSISGQLSNEAAFSTDSLPSGTHRITVLVEDSLWGQGSAHVAVTIKELTELMVRITSPAADTVFLAGGLFSPAAREYIPPGISISGRAWHFGDGSGIADITAAAPGTVVWDIPGTFEMAYQIVDTYGRTASDTLVVTVLATSEPPLVKIISPAADTTVSLGDSIFLEALEIQTVAQIVARVWEYPEGSGLEAYHDSAAVAGWRQPAYPGEFQIIFRAIDSRGAAGLDTVAVTVIDTLPPPPPPVVEIISPAAETTLVLGDSIFFEAGITPAGVALEWRAWNYGEDSGLEADSVDAPGWHRFDQTGVFSVSFTVQDTLGSLSADTVKVTVNQNQPPTADITSPAADITVARGVSIEFIATDGDDDGVIAARYWSWGQGSGITADPVADSTAQPGSRTFLAPGTFKVRYTATDNHGAQAGDSVSITVESNQLPTAQITSMSGDTTITAGDSVPLDGIGQDPDSTEISSQWSYRLDPGEPIVLASFEPPGFLRLDQEGTYWVYLTVTDSAGASTSDSARVLVEPRPPNDLPTAKIISPSRDTVVVQWCRVSFAGEDSDQDGQVVSRSWSNGLLESIDPATDTTAVIGPKLINVPGTIRILYTVTDDRGDSYSAWRILTVLANFHPTAEIISPDRDVAISAGSIVSFAAKDSDPGGAVVRREWDYGNSGIPPDSVAVPGNRTFNTQGTFKIIYKVTDNMGISWSDSLTVTVGAL